FERLNVDDLPFFLGLMEHLAAHGFPSAMPLHTRAGSALTSLNGKPAALVRRLTGQSVLFPTLEQCAQVGRALGDLHVFAQSYDGRCENARGAHWRERTGRELAQKTTDAAVRGLIEDELGAQAGLPLSALPQGVIHADLFRDNVL